MSKKTIVFAGLTSIETEGLRSIIEEDDTSRYDIRIATSGLTDSSERADAYFVSSDIFAAYADFFMPQRQRVIVICRCNHDTMPDKHRRLIFNDDTPIEIRKTVGDVLFALNSDNIRENELSGREIEVLRKVATGKINKEIADELNISVNTVITHRKNISVKLGIRSTSGLSVYAAMHGII